MNIKYLYKYGSLNEHSEILFSTPTIWFSAPSGLNDPFECSPVIKINLNSEQLVELQKRRIKKDYPYIPDNEATAVAVSNLLEARKAGRNPNSENAIESFRTEFKKIGLYCLSKDPKNILMWSHYSNCHRGYCLQFKATTPFSLQHSESFTIINIPWWNHIKLLTLNKLILFFLQSL